MELYGMCDWEAEEYAEHLLWVEAEKARARERLPQARESSRFKSSADVAFPREVAEA